MAMDENSIKHWGQKWGGITASGFATFLRAPILEDVSVEALTERNVKAAVFGVPSDVGNAARPGSSLGPRAVRNSTVGSGPVHPFFDVDILEELNLHDCGDSFIAVGNPKLTVEYGARYASEILKARAIPIVLGGDHSVMLAGTLAVDRTLEGKYGVIHLDSHLDYSSGDLYGGNEWNQGTPLRKTSELESFPCENIVHIGMRGTSNPRSDIKAAKENGITMFSMYDVVDIGFDSAIDQALKIALNGTNGFYLSIDMDVLDASCVPGASTPQCFGITTRELWPALGKLGMNNKLVGFDVVEVSPHYDPSELTAMTAKSICIELLAARATIIHNLTPPPLCQ